MDCNHLEQLDDDYVYSSKADGRRCLVRLEKGKEYRYYSNFQECRDTDYDGPIMYMDVEELTFDLVLDILFCEKPIMHMPLEVRLRYAPENWKVQSYLRARNVKYLEKLEGIIAQRESAPYGIEVLRLKYRETGDFLVEKGRAVMGLPFKCDFPSISDLTPYEGKIVELYLDTGLFYRLRDDKSEPNSSVIIARAMAEYRATIEDFLEVAKTIDPKKDDFRDPIDVHPQIFKAGTYQWHVQCDVEPEKYQGSVKDIYQGVVNNNSNSSFLTVVTHSVPTDYTRDLHQDVQMEKREIQRDRKIYKMVNADSIFTSASDKVKNKTLTSHSTASTRKRQPFFKEKGGQNSKLALSHKEVCLEKENKKKNLKTMSRIGHEFKIR